MITAAIFDFDGTLVDFFKQHLEAFHEVIKKHFNLEYTREDLDEGYGMTGEDILRLFFRKKGLKVGRQQLKEIADERRSRALEKIRKGRVKLLPGAENLLKKLRAAGFKTAIATSCSKNVCDVMFLKSPFKGRLDATTTGSEVEKGKPDPEIFLKTAEKLGAPPDECVVFEDSSYGVEAAKKAGMKVVAVTTGHDSKEKLMQKKPDRIINSLEEFSVEDMKNL
jgi:beta-phosphoglucomutase